MGQSLSWEDNGHSVKKLPAFYENRSFITVFTRARRLSISWAKWIQYTPSLPVSPRSILILSSHLGVSLPTGLFPSGLTTTLLNAFLFSPRRATCPAHRILHDLITLTIFGEVYKLRSSSFCSLLHPLATSPYYIPRSFPASSCQTSSMCSSLSVTDQVLHRYKTAGKL